MRFNWQNLNEDRKNHLKGVPYHGRCWFYPSDEYRKSFRFSWDLWSHFCCIGLSVDPSEHEVMFTIGFPPFTFWFSMTGYFSKLMNRFFESKWMRDWNTKTGGNHNEQKYSDFTLFELRIHDNALWWNFLKIDWGWSSKTPKWVDGNFNFLDFFLGRSKCTRETLSTHEVKIPMPEGQYPATVKIERWTYKRPRWFATHSDGSSIDIPWGIPFEGKGENSWDCGQDGLFGKGSNSTSLPQIIGEVVQSVLHSRQKYDGNINAVYPPPAPPPPRPPSNEPMAAAS
jgi:hypothetical protein